MLASRSAFALEAVPAALAVDTELDGSGVAIAFHVDGAFVLADNDLH
jgi:hypothetical protein